MLPGLDRIEEDGFSAKSTTKKVFTAVNKSLRFLKADYKLKNKILWFLKTDRKVKNTGVGC